MRAIDPKRPCSSQAQARHKARLLYMTRGPADLAGPLQLTSHRSPRACGQR